MREEEEDKEASEGTGADAPSADASASAGAPTDRPADAQGARIQASRNRPAQFARTGARKLFDEAAQTEFLEWFAATCNLAWAAEKAGFNYKTVLRHRMNDPHFREGWDRAVEQAVARIEAKRLETRRREEPIGIEGDYDAPELDDMSPERMDAILREHKRGIAGVKRPGRRPRVASNAEVRAALEKRLAAFRERVRSREGRPLPGEGEGDER